MKFYKVLTLLNSIGILGGIMFYIYTLNGKHVEVVYVNNLRLYNEFDMTKEAQAKLNEAMKTASLEIEGLVSAYQRLEDKTSERAKLMQNQIVIKNKGLQEQQEASQRTSNVQIRRRLQDYIKAYALKMNYRMVMGSNVLYSDAPMDKTDEALHFINQKYSGLNP